MNIEFLFLFIVTVFFAILLFREQQLYPNQSFRQDQSYARRKSNARNQKAKRSSKNLDLEKKKKSQSHEIDLGSDSDSTDLFSSDSDTLSSNSSHQFAFGRESSQRSTGIPSQRHTSARPHRKDGRGRSQPDPKIENILNNHHHDDSIDQPGRAPNTDLATPDGMAQDSKKEIKEAKKLFVPLTTGIFTCVLIGQTGSGKSTLVNMLFNFFRGGTLNNPKIAIPTKFFGVTEPDVTNTEHNVTDQTKSQTSGCSVYTLKHPSSHATFRFVDTPGIGDTRGSEQDDVNGQSILDMGVSIDELSAVIWIHNGRVPRFSPEMVYVVKKLRGNIPDKVLNNAFIVLTNCVKEKANFELKSLPFQSHKLFHI